jgi:hypothetical protein
MQQNSGEAGDISYITHAKETGAGFQHLRTSLTMSRISRYFRIEDVNMQYLGPAVGSAFISVTSAPFIEGEAITFVARICEPWLANLRGFVLVAYYLSIICLTSLDPKAKSMAHSAWPLKPAS